MSDQVCTICERGREACQYCDDASISREDWETICDCGLHDFGNHLLDCEARAAFHYVVAADYNTAELPRRDKT